MISMPFIILAIEDPDDRAFMENVYLSYNRLMYSEVYSIVKDVWATDDVMQTVVERLINKIPLLKTFTRETMINYIISASKNTARNYLRDNEKRRIFSFDEGIDSDTDAAGFDDTILKWEFSSNLWDVWKKLDERSRRLLTLKYVLEKRDDEIAEEMGIKPGSVRMAMTRARNKLKDNLNEAEMA